VRSSLARYNWLPGREIRHSTNKRANNKPLSRIALLRKSKIIRRRETINQRRSASPEEDQPCLQKRNSSSKEDNHSLQRNVLVIRR